MPAVRRSVVLLTATATAGALALLPITAATASTHPAAANTTAASGTTSASTAPAAPGAPSYFDNARKDCVGTAANTSSKVWFTVADGVLSDVYSPTIDNTNVATLQYIVSDGRTFTDLQTRDTTYTVQADPTGMSCTVTSTSAAHGYRLTTTYIADPSRDAVRMQTRITAVRGHRVDVRKLAVYTRLDAHINGNGGGGTDNGGADTGTVTNRGVGVVYDTATVSQAANRDYAVPTYAALDSPQRVTATVGYAGTASDGLTQLDGHHALTAKYSSAPNGHIVLTEQLKNRGTFDLALGFGRTSEQATSTAKTSADRSFGRSRAAYLSGWARYDARLARPNTRIAGMSRASVLRSYYLSANVLKASEDKTFPGAVVASLASPWGQAVPAGTLVSGKPVYFGSYREVFARDLYEAFTGFLADGDLATARATTRFLLEKQQLSTGELPRNSLLNGRVAPDTGGDQLDETSYPILMAWLSGLGGDATLYTQHIKPAADFVVAHGPSFGVERWEEQSGYSPSTIAAEIAGLTAAAAIAHQQHHDADARVYQATADRYQRSIKSWTLTSTGPYSAQPYFLRLTKDGNPNAGTTYSTGNGVSAQFDQRTVVDGGFQELVRLGELSPSDPDYLNSLAVLDKQIAVGTPSGTGYYRYGTSAADGSADGYGDCYQPSQSSCTAPGQPWPTTDTGTGHLWPVLSGERAESDLMTGNRAAAVAQLGFMVRSASGVGLVPEQVWEDPALAASPYGTDPTTASIGFADGHPAGSAAPLTWAQAQELRLITDLGHGRITDRPSITANRYLGGHAPGSVDVTITTPTAGTDVTSSTTVSGTTTPGATVDVSAVNSDSGGAGTTVSTTADGSGAFSVSVAVGFGTTVLTAAATTAAGTGTAQVTVVGELVGGTTVLSVTDPAGDDNGPGTYRYPTAADFVAGSFDLTGFKVLTKGGTVYLQTTLATLTPTFGNTLGAQLLDIYVHQPSAASTSTAAAFPSRNYTVAASDAWSQRIEIQGFASPTWVDPAGNQVGPPGAVVASTLTKTVTIALPAAQFGTPAAGWSFAVTLAGQDGFSSDQARAFTPTAGQYSFGVCPVGGTAAICSVDPGSVPKVVDTLTPAGVTQADELDPTRGTVAIRGVPVS